MIDKEKIKAIIKQYADRGERLYNESYNAKKDSQAIGYWDGYRDCANLLLRELDDMQEEPVSEDLEQAAKYYLYSNILYDDVYVGNPTEKDCIEMFKAGANWQLKKAINWLKSNINCDIWINDFIKNMEE